MIRGLTDVAVINPKFALLVKSDELKLPARIGNAN